ncbi:MAG: hypothetical protein JWR23_730 [Mucilaginibacter sp.]|nr:hypothetical protein [Mucilaginibacter sp.]
MLQKKIFFGKNIPFGWLALVLAAMQGNRF